MDVYLVRHGQTAMNAIGIHQMPDEPLNELGHAQAKTVANWLAGQSIDRLYASPYVRARETAQAISEAVDLPIEILESVTEFRRPDYTYGKRHVGFASLWYLWQLFTHRYDPTWDDDNAENTYAVRNRVHDTKDALIQGGGERVVVVSHAIFMNWFLELLCNEIDLTFYQCVRGILNTKRTKNTEIFHLRYDAAAAPGTCAWQLVEKIQVH